MHRSHRPHHRLGWAGTLLVLVALVAVAAGVFEAGAGSAATGSAAVPGRATITPLPYLHVVVPPGTGVTGDGNRTPFLADPTGRQVLLRGAAVVGLQDVAYPTADGGPALFPVNPKTYVGRCPKANARIPQPPLCEVQAAKPAYLQSTAPGSGDDFAQLRALGFNVIRLVLNWSQLEPTPGRYSPLYLARVAQVVGWARQQGIYVILDMHQDKYSRFILPAKTKSTVSGLPCTPSGGSDGAPAWATLTDTKPACAVDGQSTLNPASAAAFYNFYNNHTVAAPKGQAPGAGLEDHYIGALAALARTFQRNSTVLGYEIMNEPQPGSVTALPLANVYTQSSQYLYPFYQRAIEALTGVRDGLQTCPSSAPTSLTNACAYPKLAAVSRQQIFFEPMAYRNLTDFSIQVSKPFSTYPNLVYAPHIYTHAFTLDQFLGYKATASPYPPSYTFGYQTAEAEAQAMNAAVFTTEFGDNAGSDPEVLAGETAAQESTIVGGTVWAWKGLSTTQTSCWCVRWQRSSYQTTSNGTPGKGNPNAPVSRKDTLIASRGTYLDRVYPRSTVGRLLAYQYDPTTKAFMMTALVPSLATKNVKGTTVVSIPATVAGAVTVSGNARLAAVVRQPDGSRLAYATFKVACPTCLQEAGAGYNYQVTVGTPSPALQAAVKQAATHPLAPITEPAARALAEQALATASNSSTPKVKGNAAIANALAGLVLGSSDPNGAPT